MLEQKIDLLIAAIEKNTAALTGGKGATATTAAASGKPGRPAAPKVTADQLAEAAGKLKDAQGMPAVRALFKEHGSESGKIADVPKANIAAAYAAIEAALAGDEAAGEDDEGL